MKQFILVGAAICSTLFLSGCGDDPAEVVYRDRVKEVFIEDYRCEPPNFASSVDRIEDYVECVLTPHLGEYRADEIADRIEDSYRRNSYVPSQQRTVIYQPTPAYQEPVIQQPIYSSGYEPDGFDVGDAAVGAVAGAAVGYGAAKYAENKRTSKIPGTPNNGAPSKVSQAPVNPSGANKLKTLGEAERAVEERKKAELAKQAELKRQRELKERLKKQQAERAKAKSSQKSTKPSKTHKTKK